MVGTKSGNRHVYRCARYHLSGKSICHRNPIREDLLLPCIVRRLSGFWTEPGNIQQLKTALGLELESEVGGDQGARERLERQLAELEASIRRGKGRLLRAPDSVYADLVAELDAAKRQQEQLQAQLDALTARAALSDGELERMVAKALAVLGRLGEALAGAEPVTIREALVGLISRIDLHFQQEPQARYIKSRFDRGIIHVRTGLEIGSTVAPVMPDDSPSAAFC
jgi:hypothetical protein